MQSEVGAGEASLVIGQVRKEAATIEFFGSFPTSFSNVIAS